MEVFTVTFFGHRFIDNQFVLERKLERILLQLLSKKEYIEFLIGRNGDFDQCVTRTIHKIKREFRDDNNSLVLVLPYATAEYLNNIENFAGAYKTIEYAKTKNKEIINLGNFKNRSTF